MRRRNNRAASRKAAAMEVAAGPESGTMLLEPYVLEKVARYENGLEWSFFRNLHELQRLQAARSGVAVTARPCPSRIRFYWQPGPYSVP